MEIHWFEPDNGCEKCGTLHCKICGRPRSGAKHYVGGRTREEWEPIGRASMQRNSHLPDD